MERRFSYLVLLSMLLMAANAVDVTIPPGAYEVARGDNITIPCSFSAIDPTKLVLIQWLSRDVAANSEEGDVFSYYPDGSSDVALDYNGRVKVDVSIPNGKFNLNLLSVTLLDNRIFRCHVQVRGDLTKSSASIRVMVLVAPSTPECNIQGKAEYGQNINLTCLSKEGSPTPTYAWQSLDVQNNPRPMDPKTTSNGGILSLFNISKDTSGYFICTSTNKIRSAKCNLTLAVMPPSMNIGSTAGIVAGVAVFVLVLGIIICCCCCRKKNKDEEYAMGVHEDDYHDKDLAKNADGRYADGQEEIRSSENTKVKSAVDRRDEYEDRSERGDDRSERGNGRRSDYDDRRSDYDDRRSDYSDRRDKYSDRQERYDDNRRYDDDRRYNDRRDRRSDDQYYDEPYDDRNRDRPAVPSNKPPRRN